MDVWMDWWRETELRDGDGTGMKNVGRQKAIRLSDGA